MLSHMQMVNQSLYVLISRQVKGPVFLVNAH